MTKHVLCIEDEKSQIDLMECYLEREDYGMTVDFAQTGEAGIAAFDAKNYALVLIDYNLPDAEAPEIAEAILCKKTGCPIVFLSNAFTDDRLAKAENLGVLACLDKNNPKENLVQISGLLH